MNFLQRIKDGAGRASERAQSAVEIGRLNSHISDIQREIDVHLLRMGQVFYDNYRNPDTTPAEEEIMDLCTACDLLNEEILELRTRIAELRSERLCECGARLDIDAKTCPHCGRQFAEDEEPVLVPATPAAAASSEHVIPAVQLHKPGEAKTSVEVEAVHDLVDEPGFERSEERRREDRPAAFDDRTHLDQPDVEEEWEDDFRPYEREALRASQSERAALAVEDEQFETKRYELGAAETEYEREGTSAPEGSFSSDESEDFRAAPPADETPEEREERQRRELREIRMRERRKMKEAQQREHEQDAVRAAAAGVGHEEVGHGEEAVDPGYDPEYERRQRERIEREQERQDELDRLIASWNGGISRPDEEEQFIVRRPVGEVVRCQVCGSGLPKGSKWCPHCASEQI